jgi:hypothetical protein
MVQPVFNSQKAIKNWNSNVNTPIGVILIVAVKK